MPSYALPNTPAIERSFFFRSSVSVFGGELGLEVPGYRLGGSLPCWKVRKTQPSPRNAPTQLVDQYRITVESPRAPIASGVRSSANRPEAAPRSICRAKASNNAQAAAVPVPMRRRFLADIAIAVSTR